MPESQTIQLSVDYKPRPWQQEFHRGIRDKQRGVLVTSRQIGKTFSSIAEIVHRALSSPEHSTSAYFSPYISQSRRIAWPRLKAHLGPILEHCKVRESDLTITLPGDRIITLLGTDNESCRGMSIRNMILDEFDNMPDSTVRDVLLPTMSAHGDDGWLLYIGTLSGAESRLYKLYEEHLEDDDWYTKTISAVESGVFSDGFLKRKAKEMGPSSFAREMMVDPSAPVEHAVIGLQMAEADLAGRIVNNIPIRDRLIMSFDLGIRDACAVWVCQFPGKYLELVGYHEFANVGLNTVLERIRAAYPYKRIDTVVLPHDIKVREMSNGAARLNTFYEMLPDSYPAVLSPAPAIADTLQSTRLNMERCVFSYVGCRKGISRLKSARYEIDDKTSTVKDRIKHDNNSHALDSFRYLLHYVERTWPFYSGADGSNGDVEVRAVHGALG